MTEAPEAFQSAALPFPVGVGMQSLTPSINVTFVQQAGNERQP
jgi:hypothetical protein